MKKQSKKDLVEKIALDIAVVLKETDELAARKIRKHILAAAKEVVKRFVRHMEKDEPKKEKSPEKVVSRKAVSRKVVKAVRDQAANKNGVVAVKTKAVRKKPVKGVRRK